MRLSVIGSTSRSSANPLWLIPSFWARYVSTCHCDRVSPEPCAFCSNLFLSNRATSCSRNPSAGESTSTVQKLLRRLPPNPDGLCQSRRRRDGGLPRKDLLQQHPMRLLVAVGAAIADDQRPVVRIGGMAQGREYDTAGGDTRQDQGLDAVGAQHQVEIGRGEGAPPMLGDDDFVGQRRDGR